MSENYGDNRWATFKQMEEKGWTFKKDEEGNSLAKGKGASIEYYEMRDKETKRRFDRSVLDGMTASEQQEYMDKNVYWLRKFYRVFNCSLMDGVPVKEKPQIDVNDRNDRAEAILDYWDKNEAKIVYGGSRAFYRTDTDEVHLPERADFKSMQEFYSTALHEIGHSTGHESRLNRDLSGRFGSEDYAMEELRAEIASIFMEQDLEIEPSEGRRTTRRIYSLGKKKSKKTQMLYLRQLPTRIKSQNTFQGKNKHIGRPKIFSFTRLLRKRMLIRNRYTNAVSATKKAE